MTSQTTITRVRVPVYLDIDVNRSGVPITLYPFEVLYASGKVHKVSKRYSDVLNFHNTLLKAAPHHAIELFNFPHKSWMSTTAEFTKERRRSGFEEYFEMLLRLGDVYAPFVFTFLQHGEFKSESAFDELGVESPPPAPEDLASPMISSPARAAPAQRMGGLVLARPRDAGEWVCKFYAPVAGVAFAYAWLLTLLGVVRPSDWRGGGAWLAILTAPLVLCVATALASPASDL
ncbi:hypothetical protein M885DRAFT_518557 [Pelagophyceae sp. CCMP2097]|nr:hypothetical protein M885DRAFT_518557 [Pelagophyceae sp. CCMP2097]|mmetsp:Transcript_5455/g.17272  ORF Transcript_5455/g.17272 Transcript_5455/m.17272 type:complete len:232 (+) Transcript_5455:110-805(+)